MKKFKNDKGKKEFSSLQLVSLIEKLNWVAAILITIQYFSEDSTHTCRAMRM